jgi:signal transduction histidine kinase
LFYDSNTLPLTTLGSIVNALGLAIPLAILASVPAGPHRKAFGLWSASYASMLLAVLSMGLLEPLRFPGGLLATCFVAYAASSATMLLASEAIAERDWRKSPTVALTIGPLALATGLSAVGHPFALAAVPLALVNLGVHIQLGVTLLRNRRRRADLMLPVVGGWTIFAGLWVLAYPPMALAQVSWLGYMVAGVNHAVVGIGVALLLLRESQAKLQEQHQQLLAIDRVKTDFIANLSHELRTPLTVINTGTWMLTAKGSELSGDESQAILGDLSKTTLQLTQLVNSLIDFSASELGKLTCEPCPSDLEEVVRSSCEAHRQLFRAKGVQLEFERPGELQANFDAARLRQVLANLLDNALKFTPPGGTVHVTLASRDGNAVLTVADSGPGIPEPLLGAVFERFYQVNGGKQSKSAGLGLGLAICKSIIEEGHGGQIWAESPHTGGCRIVVDLGPCETHQTFEAATAS